LQQIIVVAANFL